MRFFGPRGQGRYLQISAGWGARRPEESPGKIYGAPNETNRWTPRECSAPARGPDESRGKSPQRHTAMDRRAGVARRIKKATARNSDRR